jgi:hypothetical protein
MSKRERERDRMRVRVSAREWNGVDEAVVRREIFLISLSKPFFEYVCDCMDSVTLQRKLCDSIFRESLKK